MTLHGVGGGDEVAEWASDTDLYFSDALDSCGSITTTEDDNVSPAHNRGRGDYCQDNSSSSSSYNFQHHQKMSISKKKIISDDNISLESYSAMLSKHRQNNNEGEEDGTRHNAKQAKKTMNNFVKFRYMR